MVEPFRGGFTERETETVRKPPLEAPAVPLLPPAPVPERVPQEA